VTWPPSHALAVHARLERASLRADQLDDLAYTIADQIAEIAGTARRCSPDDVDELRHDYHRIDDRDWSWVVRRALVVLERQGRPVLVVPGEE
jgi:hypothetical protein